MSEPSAPVRASDLAALEQLLRKAIMDQAKPGVSSEEDTLKRAFKRIDLHESGEVDFGEFCQAVEAFGIEAARGAGAYLKHGTGSLHGGVPQPWLRALFDKYDANGNGSLSYDEFASGLFTKFVGGMPSHAVGMASSASPTGRRPVAGTRRRRGSRATSRTAPRSAPTRGSPPSAAPRASTRTTSAPTRRSPPCAPSPLPTPSGATRSDEPDQRGTRCQNDVGARRGATGVIYHHL